MLLLITPPFVKFQLKHTREAKNNKHQPRRVERERERKQRATYLRGETGEMLSVTTGVHETSQGARELLHLCACVVCQHNTFWLGNKSISNEQNWNCSGAKNWDKLCCSRLKMSMCVFISIWSHFHGCDTRRIHLTHPAMYHYQPVREINASIFSGDYGGKRSCYWKCIP